MKRAILLIITSGVLQNSGLALARSLVEVEPLRRTISVRGDADIKINPDYAVINLGADSWGKDLDETKRSNDERIRKVLSILAKEKIGSSDIQTGFIKVEPTYDNHYDRNSNPIGRLLIGYRVQKSLSVTLKDLSKFDEVLSAVQRGGANVLDGVEFFTTDLRKYRDQARTMAIKAAREKAEALSRELGMKVGKAITIGEDHSNYWSSYWGGRNYSNVSQNLAQNSSGAGGDGDGVSGTIAPGKITVTAGVSVSFEIE